MTRWLPLVPLTFLACLVGPAHAATIQNFDSAGTDFDLATLGTATPPSQINNALPGINTYLRLGHAAKNDLINTVGFDNEDPGRFEKVIADFDFRIGARLFFTGEGLAFVLLETAVHGTSGPAPAITEEPNLPGAFGVGFDVAGVNNNHLSLHLNGATLAEFDPGFDLAAGLFHHAQVTLEEVPGGVEVTVILTRNLGPALSPIFAAPNTPVSKHFIAGFTPFESRVAFGAHTGAATSSNLDIDNINVQVTPAAVPEPGTLVLLAGGLAAVAVLRRVRRSNTR